MSRKLALSLFGVLAITLTLTLVGCSSDSDSSSSEEAAPASEPSEQRDSFLDTVVGGHLVREVLAESESKDPALRIGAAGKLAVMGDHPTILETILNLSRDSVPEVRAAAVRALTPKTPTEAIANRLSDLASDPSAEVRVAVGQTYGRYVSEPSFRSAAFAKMDALVVDANPDVRVGAVQGLGRAAYDSGVWLIMIEVLDTRLDLKRRSEREVQVTSIALTYLGEKTPDAEAIFAFDQVARLSYRRSSEIQHARANAIGTLVSRFPSLGFQGRALTELWALSRNSSEVVRQRTAAAVKQVDPGLVDSRSSSILVELARDSDPDVRTAAREALL